MESFTKITTLSHVIVGFISLILFWLPVFTRKGGKLHRKIGNLYVYCMWFVVITAAILSVKNVIIQEYNAAIFLGFLTFITGNPLWYGVAILKNKKEPSLRFKQIHYSINIAIILFSITMITYALFNLSSGASILMMFFGMLGIASIPQLIRDYKSQMEGKSWFKEHYVGMVTTGTAAYTAFLAFGGRQYLDGILTGYWQILPWILPTILTFVGLAFARRYYEKKGILKPSKKKQERMARAA
ncbi:MAG: hypothetical protein AAFR87_15465 [Bacteroidota bacterium]